MFIRKLTALNYPNVTEFNYNDDVKFRKLVGWLEEFKIQHYKEEDRAGLKQVDNDKWPEYFDKYLKELGVRGDRKEEVTDRLLGIAVGLEYGKDFEKYTASPGFGKTKAATENPFDKLDYNSRAFIEGVNAVADILKVTKHPNHLLTLEACGRLIQSRYSKNSIKNGENVPKLGEAFPFEDVDQSFDSGDNVLNQAAKILRLLFIMDLRELQTKINECIVAVQTITSDPKTDIRQGKVGY